VKGLRVTLAQANEVSKRFGDFTAVDRVDLYVSELYNR
jgi:ABC-type branched-subunit amino acid transport system ATPase component